MDLFYFGAVFNLIWNIFTILFVLYRFTSFFTYMFGFIRFCGRIASNAKYFFNRLLNRPGSGYIRLPDDHDQDHDEPLISNAFTDNPTSIWSRMKSGYNTVTNYIWSKPVGSSGEPLSVPVYVEQRETAIPLQRTVYQSTHPDINTKSKEHASVVLDNPFDRRHYNSSFHPYFNSQLSNEPTPHKTQTIYSNFINFFPKDVVYPFAAQNADKNHPFHESVDSDSSLSNVL